MWKSLRILSSNELSDHSDPRMWAIKINLKSKLNEDINIKARNRAGVLSALGQFGTDLARHIYIRSTDPRPIRNHLDWIIRQYRTHYQTSWLDNVEHMSPILARKPEQRSWSKSFRWPIYEFLSYCWWIH